MLIWLRLVRGLEKMESRLASVIVVKGTARLLCVDHNIRDESLLVWLRSDSLEIKKEPRLVVPGIVFKRRHPSCGGT